jgi:hypothetical protein
MAFQPEALLLYERLQNNPSGIQEAWAEEFEPKELERLANFFGVSLD